MTIPWVLKAAVRNSCQWSFFPKPSPALHPCSPDLPRGCCDIPCRTARGKELHLPHQVPSSSASPQGSCSSPAFPELQLQSICISSSDTHQRKHAHSFPCYCTKALWFILFMFLKQHKSQNPKIHEEVTLVWPSTHLSHLCWPEDHCTRKYFTKWFFLPPRGQILALNFKSCH